MRERLFCHFARALYDSITGDSLPWYKKWPSRKVDISRVREKEKAPRWGRKSNIKRIPDQLRNLADLFLASFYFNHSCGNVSIRSNQIFIIRNTSAWNIHTRCECEYWDTGYEFPILAGFNYYSLDTVQTISRKIDNGLHAIRVSISCRLKNFDMRLNHVKINIHTHTRQRRYTNNNKSSGFNSFNAHIVIER